MSQQQSRWIRGTAMAAVLVSGPAGATTVTLVDPAIQLSNAGINDIGFFSGFGIFLDADVLGGLAGPGTTVTAFTKDTISGELRRASLPYRGNTADPNTYTDTIPDQAGLHGRWTMIFTNGGDKTTRDVALPVGATQLPPISNLTISGSKANPTFDWVAPAGRVVEGYRINLYDQNLVDKTGTLANGVLTTTITSTEFTVPTDLAGGLKLDSTHRYTIRINALENRDGSSNLNNANVFARSGTYFDF
ncbi:MAG TPA: hypothetical protein VLI93_16065, partial [Acetobacteraceae bacterium]|nr:hypothetical protein [Acetobacteraceae bacterium]